MSCYEQAQQSRRAISDQARAIGLIAKHWTGDGSPREYKRELELVSQAERHLWIAAEALRLACAGTREKMTASPIPRG